MEITNCDGGTLYIKNENVLEFKIMITKSLGIFKTQGDISLPPVKIEKTHVCSYSVLNNEAVNIEDVYESKLFDFSGPKNYDALTGYKTTSMMVIPMQNNRDEMIGALQLINAKDSENNIIPFDKRIENVILSLASQVAISLTNVNYSREITELIESMVETFSTVIYSRTKYNVTHTQNMVKYASKFIDWLNEKDSFIKFSDEEKRMFIMSVRLHDVGKLVTPLEVMDKPSRLSRRYDVLLDRLEIIALLIKIDSLEKNYDGKMLIKEVDDAKLLVKEINNVEFVTDEMISKVEEIYKKTYIDRDGVKKPWITFEEYECLTIRRGTLTEKERDIMQEHAKLSKEILNKMDFKGVYSKIPKWAGDHHELLNGKGYPLGLSGNEIMKETRLMTIIDIFDGLTAVDRPYKPPVAVDTVLDILRDMAKNDMIDREILELFIESKVWE